MVNELFQKHHGLPGVPQTIGNPGGDGTQGSNIYFGNVAEFFDSVEVSVDTFVRIASKKNTSTKKYYTGVFEQTSTGGSDDEVTYTYEDMEDINTYWPSDNPPSPTPNVFQNIYNIPGFGEIYNESYRKIEETGEYENIHYSKVDMRSNAPIDPSTRQRVKWTTGEASGSSSYPTVNPNSQYIAGAESSKFYLGPDPYKPYSNYDPGSDPFDYMPGYNSIGKIDGFELFSITDNDTNYTYSTDNNLYRDSISGSRRFITSSNNPNFDEPGDMHTMNSVSIDDLSEVYESGDNRSQLNYLKTNSKLFVNVVFTDRLKSDIKAGDVIYFYTDQTSFEYDHKVKYMVVVTKELERCELSELIAHATIVEPFTFKYIDEATITGENYISTTNKVSAVYYSGDDESVYGKNFANYIGYSSKGVINVGSYESDIDTNSQMLTLDYNNTARLNIYNQNTTVGSSGTYEPKIHFITTGSDRIPLKISNPLFKNKNIGNIEVEETFKTNYVYTDAMGYAYTLEESDFDAVNNKFLVTSERLLKDTTYSDYKVGATVIEFNNSEIEESNAVYQESENVHISRLVFSNKIVNIPLTNTRYGDYTSYIVTIWVSEAGKMPRYSKNTVAKYVPEIKTYEIYELGDYSGTVPDESDESGKVEFVTYGISPDKVENGSLDIYIPYNVLNDEHIYPTNIRIFVNSEYDVLNGSYQNSWFSISNVNVVEPGVRNGKNFYHITSKLDMLDNIPQIDAGSDMTTAKDFNANPGTNSNADGCDVFNMLMSGKTLSSTQRSVLVTVVYNIGSKEYKSYFKIIQPGYTEKRRVPKVSLSIDKELQSLEKANSISNGVMCNQFQFYVNVDIDDFDSDIWGSYINDSSVRLNFDIRNVTTDYDFIEKYSSESAYETYTLHCNTKSEDFVNNYVSMNTYFVNNDVADPYNMSQKQLDESHIDTLKNIGTSEITDRYNTTDDFTMSYDTLKKKYQPTKADMFNMPYVRSSGFNDSIRIKFRNVTFEQAQNGRFRFRVVTEMSNPVLSRLFFRFYVSDMWVAYDTGASVNNFYVGTNNLAQMVQSGHLTTYNYMYSTDTFYAFVCPVSLTAIADSLYDDLENNNDSVVKMTGSVKQVMLSVDKYVPVAIESYDNSQRLEKYTKEQIVPWDEFGLKKRYFQDNIRNLRIVPIHLRDYADKLSYLEIVNYWRSPVSGNYKDVINEYKSIMKDEGYMQVVFNTMFFHEQRREDEMTFYYNNALYSSSNYNQFGSDGPVFTRQEVECSVRDTKLSSSVRAWNAEYETNRTSGSGLFLGINNLYGNGYQYLDDTEDENQYTAKDEIYSLSDTKLYNEEYVFDAPYSQNMLIPAKSSAMVPSAGKWFRNLLYQIVWKYPKHYIDVSDSMEKICSYEIVDGYEISKSSARQSGVIDSIPYNLTYSIYPRCLYDDEHNTAVVMMLRRPSVCKENKYKMVRSDFMFNTDSAGYDTASNTVSGDRTKLNVIV